MKKYDFDSIMDRASELASELGEMCVHSDETCQNANAVLSLFNSKLLPVAAMSGGIKGKEDISTKQKIVLMGNMNVVTAVKAIDESGLLNVLELVDSVRGGK